VNRILGRYLLKEILAPLGVWVAFLVLLFFVLAFLKGSSVLLGSGITFADFGKFVLYLTPHILNQALPIAFLLAILLGIGRLNEDLEITAMQSLGVGPRQFLGGPLTLASAVSALMLLMAFTVDPWGLRSVKLVANEIIKRNLVGDVKPGVFYDDLSDLTLYAETVDEGTGRWHHVLIHDDRDKSSPMLVLANAGSVNPQGQGDALKLALLDGTLHRAAQESSEYTLVEFERGEIVVGVGENFWHQNRFRSPKEELTPGELLEGARDAESRGEDPRAYYSNYYSRYSTAAMPLAFAIFGTALAISRRRAGRARGFILAMGGYLLWYVVFRVCVNLADKGRLAPIFVALGPNVLFAALGAFALVRVLRAGTVRA
jgi:lipopolysaccharide export system permease protein